MADEGSAPVVISALRQRAAAAVAVATLPLPDRDDCRRARFPCRRGRNARTAHVRQRLVRGLSSEKVVNACGTWSWSELVRAVDAALRRRQQFRRRAPGRGARTLDPLPVRREPCLVRMDASRAPRRHPGQGVALLALRDGNRKVPERRRVHDPARPGRGVLDLQQRARTRRRPRRAANRTGPSPRNEDLFISSTLPGPIRESAAFRGSSRTSRAEFIAMPEVQLVPVSWSVDLRAIVHTEQKLLDNFARHGGPVLEASSDALEPIAPEPGEWLLSAEAPHLGTHDMAYPPVLIDEVLGFARALSMRVGVVLHDIMPLTSDLASRRRRAFVDLARGEPGGDEAEVQRLRFAVYAHGLAMVDLVLPVSRTSGDLSRRLAHGTRAPGATPAADLAEPASGRGSSRPARRSPQSHERGARPSGIPDDRDGLHPQEPARRHGGFSPTDRPAAGARLAAERRRDGRAGRRRGGQPACPALEGQDRSAWPPSRRPARRPAGLRLGHRFHLARGRLRAPGRRESVAREAVPVLRRRVDRRNRGRRRVSSRRSPQSRRDRGGV